MFKHKYLAIKCRA